MKWTGTHQYMCLCLQKREIALEILNYRKNGEKFWNLLSLMPVKDAYGNVVSFIGVQSDITELIRRKHAERELQQAKVGALANPKPACACRAPVMHAACQSLRKCDGSLGRATFANGPVIFERGLCLGYSISSLAMRMGGVMVSTPNPGVIEHVPS